MRKQSVTPPVAATAPRPDGVDRESLVRLTAYSLFERHGRREGRALDDWLEAEAIVDAEFARHREAVVEIPRAAGRAPQRVRAA